jgi:hypothetical protein
MIRTVSLASVVLVGALAAAGCNGASSSNPKDAPVVGSQGVDKKGNKSKTMEAAIEDPSSKK